MDSGADPLAGSVLMSVGAAAGGKQGLVCRVIGVSSLSGSLVQVWA